MKDVSILNEMIFSASTENELQEKFEYISPYQQRE